MNCWRVTWTDRTGIMHVEFCSTRRGARLLAKQRKGRVKRCTEKHA